MSDTKIICAPSIDQQPPTQPAVSGDTGNEKMFNQTELDEIIRTRLKREREANYRRVREELESEFEEKLAVELNKQKLSRSEPSAQELKEQELAARESRLECMEYVAAQHLPRELLDVLETSDPKEFCKKADVVSALLRQARGPAPLFDPESGLFMREESGFDRNSKHIPALAYRYE